MIFNIKLHLKNIKRTIGFYLAWLLFIIPARSIASAGSLDSLLVRLSNSKNDSAKVDLLNNISFEYWNLHYKDFNNLANPYADSALSLAKKINYKNGLARVLFLKGKFLVTLSFDKATSFLLQSLIIYDELNDVNGIAECHLQLGVISYSLQNYAEALSHFKICITNKDVNHTTSTIAHYLLAICYSEIDSVRAALKHFNTALWGYKTKHDTTGIIQCFTYIGKMYINTGENGEAIKSLMDAVRLGKENKVDPGTLARSYSFLSTAFLHVGQIDSAIYYGEMAVESDDWLTNKEAMASLGEAYGKKGIYEKAFLYLRKLKILNDSVYSSNIVNNTAELRSKFEFEKQLSRQKAEQEKVSVQQKSDLEKQELLRNAMLFISVLLIILLLVVLNRFRLKQKHTKQLTLAYDHLRETQGKLVQQEKMASLGTLTAGIAHEIKNPLNFVANFSQLSYEMLDEFLASSSEKDRIELGRDIRKNLEKINYHSLRANSIVQSMLLNTRSSTAEKQLTDVNAVCDEFAELAYQAFLLNNAGAGIAIKKEFDPALPQVNVIRQDISRVILNLVNNALHAVKQKSVQLADLQPNGKKPVYQPSVTISTASHSGRITISIRDNGIGIPKGIMQKIFEPFYTTKSAGEGTGLGLSICFDIVKTLGGDIKAESEENEFATFIVTLPY
jgi:signal transduction histidine kinase